MQTNSRLTALAEALVTEVIKPEHNIFRLLEDLDTFTKAPTSFSNLLATYSTGYRTKLRTILYDNIRIACEAVFKRPELNLTSNPNHVKSTLDAYTNILNEMMYGVEHYLVNTSTYDKLREHHYTVYRGYPATSPGIFKGKFTEYMRKALDNRLGSLVKPYSDHLAGLVAAETSNYLYQIGILNPVIPDYEVEWLQELIRKNDIINIEDAVTRALNQVEYYQNPAVIHNNPNTWPHPSDKR